MNQEILSYAKEALRSGTTPQDIRSALLGAGWPASDVDETLAAIAAPSAPAIPAASGAAQPTPDAMVSQLPASGAGPLYVRNPKTTKRGIWLIAGPFVGLILILVAYAVISSILLSSMATPKMSAPLTTSGLQQAGSLSSGNLGLAPATPALRYGGLIRALLGFLGIICVIGIIFGFPIGIILLFKRRLDPNAPYDARSGQRGSSVIPPEIRGWNWGAAGLTFIWGVYYSVWISLLSFIPVLNLVVMIYLGLKGNEAAWKKNRWPSVEAFKASQEKWKVWGIIFFILSLLGAAGQALAGSMQLVAVLSLIGMAAR